MSAPAGNETNLVDLDVFLRRYQAGDNSNGLRVQNASSDEWQRKNIIERTGSIAIRASLVDVVHGYMKEPRAGGPFATLLVFKFRFDRLTNGRRIKKACIRLSFSPLEPEGSCPKVYAIDPEDRVYITPSTDTREIKETLGLEVSPPYVAFSGSREQTRQKITQGAITVTGSINLAEDVNSGDPTCASWTLLENKVRSTSVPDSIRTSVLLERESNDKFQCMVTIDCETDFMSKIEGYFARFRLDDPVRFNPDGQPNDSLDMMSIDLKGYREIWVDGHAY
ncbi:hypothetical protein ASPBRDRAFT_37299 [Aspergillus brasiliensis CBS 101740]|uniref:Uncharacterized protein n=1 Tax=Aspergillus brasiliensis (strain CBS 101740 / IMI 381727 / IBT 21946) TaxID=767769 RepID=A0A1L9V2C6_ASPBC|nr:hypothetical protein ASPBRDRAFT_37299 [Aspergillus brasiliensis CBS 101740]